MWYAPQTNWPMAQQWWGPYHPYTPYHHGMPSVHSPYPTPYPKPIMSYPNPMTSYPKSMTSPMQQAGILSQFKTSDGTYDIPKMMNTMGQMMSMVNQMGGMVKGLTQTFKV
ncbi:YppG-like protein [Thermolongibacillus altinsuensis]|jgi:hypothetical protein|uniref:YppG-like protein n=1 Tax=Thermolongibacillus altinsuensis TaxID=575256 RepID=A0A4R1QI34_9BACL|nr:YppG family protein [Thermolongibacillus altinsuensis]TCL53228.1 YppG-like protein [Thermolongibacillus altinsuensis]GMB07923.1 hypothetical protein B1no1_06330 [Thermolongibacillus altinsuensis]